MSLVAGQRVAIANRGEIAVRIAATCRRLGAVPILLLGEPDLEGFAARQVGRVETVGEAGSEFDVARVVAAARRAGAAFLHPGYGFLSERAALAEACEEAGIRFVGPSPATLSLCGDKLATRAAAERAGAPLLPASPPLGNDNPAAWVEAARGVGYPLLVKPAGAGGGRGLRRVVDESSLLEAVAASRRESASSGAGDLVYLERELVDARHVEVQIVVDGQQTLVLGDRDCSLQRRNQKVIEEAPAPNIRAEIRRGLHEHARRISEEVGLRGIATCEFLLGADGTLAFLEVNPRIQVEHPVTELVTGVDLVEWQLLIAAGGYLPRHPPTGPRGHAIEARIYAEDPSAGFFPAAGRLVTVSWPVRPDVRIDAG
ncbi:MAG: ATP-grasp domain-containing protein, partial [Chloroflexota bacterium]|nr:ATP-grasp domain-containing protein [Chloroflexota bacterium]